MVCSTLLIGKISGVEAPVVENLIRTEPTRNEIPMVGQNSLLPIPHMRVEEIEAIITYYNPVESQTDSTPDIMASGEKVREGAIACPEEMEFGVTVEIDNKIYTCQDRMHERYRDGKYFDILTFSLEEAIEFGRQIRIVKIYY